MAALPNGSLAALVEHIVVTGGKTRQILTIFIYLGRFNIYTAEVFGSDRPNSRFLEC